MNAKTMRRISSTWQDYQDFLNTESVGDHTLREMVESAPSKQDKINTLKVVCGEPPFPSMNCGLLAWEIDRERM